MRDRREYMPLNQFTILAPVPQNANLSKEYPARFTVQNSAAGLQVGISRRSAVMR